MHDERVQAAALRGGIDLGGTKIQAVIVDCEHVVRGAARRATPTSGGPKAVVRALAATLADAATAAGVEVRALSGVGVGSPGAVDAARGTVTNARNLPGFVKRVALAAMLEREIGVAVQLGNDVGVAVDAEAVLGAGRGARAFVGLWWGTGIGGGVVLDGKRWLGRGAAGEIGHTLVKRNGARCPCGRRGCLEAYAGRRAMELRARRLVARGAKTRLFKLMKRKRLTSPTSGVWAKALAKEDRVATELIERALDSIAAALASTVNLLDVDTLVIGGGLGTRLGQPYAERIAERMQQHLFRPDHAPVVKVSELGDLGGAIGASLLVAVREPIALEAPIEPA